MYGIHVTRLPSNVTDKHLKVYFSNPRNGGGHVEKMFFPLPHNSAVVFFEDSKVVDGLIKERHQIMNTNIDVCPLPKQFIGDVKVDFQYDKQTYVLDGSWYQIEWALQYLDTMLDVFGFEADDGKLSRGSATSGNRQMASGAARNSQAPPPATEVTFFESATSRHTEIKQPNIPSINPPENTGQYGRMQEGMSSIKSNKNKNKNVMPRSMGTPAGGNQQFDNTLRRNTEQVERKPTVATSAKKNNLNVDDPSGEETPFIADMGAYGGAGGINTYDYRGFDSDSDNDDLTAGPRPQRKAPPMPEMTRGLDVAQANFGDEQVALDFSFDMPGRIKVRVAMDDITRQTTDALVNPTNATMSSQSGVSRAIVGAAGYDLKHECRKYAEENGDLNVADKVGFVMHTLGPTWRESNGESCAHMLVCTYLNCLLYADRKLWLQSLSLPLISAGPFGFPLDVCISAFFDALLLFSASADDSLKLTFINVVCFDEDSAMAAIMIVRSLLDCEATQSSSAALDRYMTRKTNFNFKAELFTDISVTGVKEDADSSEDEDDSDEHDDDVNEPVKEKEWEEFTPEENDIKRGTKKPKAENVDEERYESTHEPDDIRKDENVSDEEDDICPSDEDTPDNDKREKLVGDVTVGEETDSRITEGGNSGGAGASSMESGRDEDVDDGDDEDGGDTEKGAKRPLTTMDAQESFVHVSMEHKNTVSMARPSGGGKLETNETDI
ncbi:Y508-like protein [Mya arenaria]|uniref:Y508-like protein n=1 Tax=Mya arenaria TaxID=6604 RepID=A0ABY7FUB8_MYAAR|nr:Y508-like protein [Mya arenaria]